MRHGSLFSGVGGFDIAAECMGWSNEFHCEINPFGRRILEYYWPNAISHHDITKTDFTIFRGLIDVLTGGFPCQPYSLAGSRKGTSDERHLWPEMLRAIREAAPTWVVGENVRGLVNWNGGMVFDQVQADLEANGYEVLPFLLPACGVNAPHRRDRIWFVAYASGNGYGRNSGFETAGRTPSEGEVFRDQRERLWPDAGGNGTEGIASNTIDQGLQGHQQPVVPGEVRVQEGRAAAELYPPQDWNAWPSQSPVCPGNDGISPGLDGTSFSAKRKYATWRNATLKAAGNAIVPQVALQIFKAIEQYERSIG